MIDKQIVRRRFARSTASYAEAAEVQRAMGLALLDLLTSGTLRRDFDRILEIGCGGGGLSLELPARLEYCRLFLNDLVPECAGLAARLPDSVFLAGDVETVGLPDDLDLVLANAVFQWLRSPATLLRRLAGLLRPGGLLAFSVFGPENFREIRQLTGAGLDYPPPSFWQQELEKHFEVLAFHAEQEICFFNSPEAVLRHLKATGVTATGAGSRWTRGRLAQFDTEYRRRFAAATGDFPLTYHPILLVARKKDL